MAIPGYPTNGQPPTQGTPPPTSPTSNGPCLHGSHQGPNGNIICNPDPGAGSGGHPADDRISEDQWAAWEQFKDPACPANAPYRSERGAQGCFEKPVDCPDGQMPAGPGTAPCIANEEAIRRSGGAGGAGGGGGAAGSPSSGGVGSAFMDPAAGMAGLTGSAIGGILSGKSTRFNPEVMAALTGSAKLREQQNLRQGTQQLREQQAQRGVFNSPVGAAQERQLTSAAASDFDSTMRQIEVNKATADFEDKMSGINAGMKWAADLRNYMLGLDSNNVAREGIAANLELGYANIKSQMDLLMQKFLGDKDLLGMQLDSKEYEDMNKMILCLNMGIC